MPRRTLRRPLEFFATFLCAGCVEAATPFDAGALEDVGAAPEAGPGVGCPSFAPGVTTGRVADPSLDEISGLVASRDQAGVLWVHEDSGGGPFLTALGLDGTTRGRAVLEGAPSLDWEDLALEPVDGGADRLWLGDIGDNAARDGRGTPRTSVDLLRVEEPVATAGSTAAPSVVAFERLTLRYPDRPHDAEALAFDPETSDLYVFAKEDSGPSSVYVARAPHAFGAEVVLEQVATIDTGSSVTAADLLGDELLVRTYRGVLLFARSAGESWSTALSRPGRILPRATEPQGESIGFLPDGSAYVTVSEGAGVPLWRFDRRCP